jgi:hypothetical protein
MDQGRVAVKTSKILLIAWLLMGAVTLFVKELSTHLLVLWLAGLAALVWNRIDSRARSYRVEMKGPGGSGVTLHAEGQDE